jgi:endonuclease/exonuclease/phosphatase (EEP) superfamily protein YafD
VSALDVLATAAAAWSPVVILPAVALAGLALHTRAWALAVTAAVAGILPWVFVADYAIPGAAVPVAGTRLRVLLADADAGGANPASLVAATLRQPVDVLVLTEATPMLTHALAAGGLDPRLTPRWVSTPAGAPLAGLAVYSRYAIVSTDAVTGTRWPAARITLDTGKGRVAVVVGRVSPPGEGTARWRSDLVALGDAARAGGPAVIAGTLDASPDQSAFRRLTSHGLQDAAAALGRGLRPTWPSWAVLPLLPLDHVVVGGGIGVRSVSTVPVAGTSHRALVAELVVPPAADGTGD